MNSFREVERKLCIIPDQISVRILDPEGVTQGNAVLCCGYVDHRMGLSYEVLGLVCCVEEDYSLIPSDPTMGLKLRANSVDAAEVRPIENKALMAQFADRLDTLDIYYRDKAVVETRAHKELDPFRHPEFPDDVGVYFIPEDDRPERMWVRTEKVLRTVEGRYLFCGKLLNVPYHDPRLHCGSAVSFCVMPIGEGMQCIGVPDMPKD